MFLLLSLTMTYCKMQLILILWFFTLAYGLKVIPTPKDGVISYNSSDESSSLKFREELKTFWDSYFGPISKDDLRIHSVIQCNDGEPPEERSNKVCAIDPNDFESCNPNTAFMYNSSESGPCIFIQARKIVNWQPEYYNSTTYPEHMPLRDHLIEFENKQYPVMPVICLVEKEADIENIGVISFYPKLGFDGKYFPIRNEDDYLTPLIALHFQKPKRGISVKVNCEAWAANLTNETVHFEILVQ